MMDNTKIETTFLPGCWQKLKIISVNHSGAYLGSEEEKVLLPGKQIPAGKREGDEIEVFIYKDSKDRLIATVNSPRITLGQIAPLKVKENTKIGAFLDWGLEKDLLLPYGQQTEPVEEGKFYPVALYVDKSGRLAATMWIDQYIKGDSVDEKRRKKSLIILEADAENIYCGIEKKGGRLFYSDKADPDVIKKDFGLSKNSFKRALGMLYKARRVVINDDSVEII